MAVNINSIKYIPDLPGASAPKGADLLHLSQGNVDKQITLTTLLAYINDAAHPVGSLLFFGNKGRDPNTLFPGQTWVRYAEDTTFRGCKNDESNLDTTNGNDTVELLVDNIPSHAHGAEGLTTEANAAVTPTITIAQASAGTPTVKSVSNPGDHTHGTSMSNPGDHQHIIPWGENSAQGMRSPWGTPSGYNGNNRFGAADSDWDNNWMLSSPSGGHTHSITMAGAGGHTHSIAMNAMANHGHSATSSQIPGHTHAVVGQTANTGKNTAFSVLNKVRYVAAWRRVS